MADQERRSHFPVEQNTIRQISNTEAFFNPEFGERVTLTRQPDGTYSVIVESLVVSAAEDEQAVGEMTHSSRQLIYDRIRLNAAKMQAGSETDDPDMSAIFAEGRFEKAVLHYAEIGYSLERVLESVLAGAKQISLGEVKMGEMPPLVQENYAALNAQAREIYAEYEKRRRR